MEAPPEQPEQEPPFNVEGSLEQIVLLIPMLDLKELQQLRFEIFERLMAVADQREALSLRYDRIESVVEIIEAELMERLFGK